MQLSSQKTQKLTLSLMMLGIASTSAWSKVYVETTPHVKVKKTEDLLFCQSVVNTIEQTPDFFKRFEQEGYKYILYDSPFRHHSIQPIEPYFVYLLNIQDYARWEQDIISTGMDYMGIHNNRPIERKIKILNVLKRKMDEEWYNGIGESLKYQSEYYSKHYLNNLNAIAYKVRTNFNNKIDIEEYTVGVFNYNGYGPEKPAYYTSEYFIVDRNGQPHPKMLSDHLYVYEGEDKIFPSKIPLFVHGQGVPINVKHKSYDLVVYCYQPNGWEQKAKKCDKGKIELTIMRRIPFGIGYLCEIKF